MGRNPFELVLKYLCNLALGHFKYNQKPLSNIKSAFNNHRLAFFRITMRNFQIINTLPEDLRSSLQPYRAEHLQVRISDFFNFLTLIFFFAPFSYDQAMMRVYGVARLRGCLSLSTKDSLLSRPPSNIPIRSHLSTCLYPFRVQRVSLDRRWRGLRQQSGAAALL